jgi:hypothetical protein
LFLPTTPLAAAVPAAAPLGDLHNGVCAAAPGAAIDNTILQRCCNNGYGRSECPRAAASEADAARFLIRSHHEDTIEIAWAQERDHHPFGVGVLQFSPEMAESAEPLQRQAAAFAMCYLRQNGRPQHP